MNLSFGFSFQRLGSRFNESTTGNHTVGTPLVTVQAMAEAAVDEALARNPGSTGTADARQVVLVELGNVGGDRRFTVPACATPCTVEDVSAVRVQTTSVVPYVFAIGATDDDDPGPAATHFLF